MNTLNKFFFLFFFLFFLFTGSIQSQNKEIDSLKNELKNHKEKDTIRVNILNHLAFHHYRNNPPQAIAYIEESLKLAKELEVPKFTAHTYYIKAIVFMEQANFKVAEDNYKKAIQIYATIDDLKGLEKCNNGIGVLYLYKGDNKKALKHYKKAIVYAEKNGDTYSIHKYLQNIGAIYSSEGDFDNALKNFKLALNIHKKNKDSLGLLNNYNLIGSLYYEQGNYPLSLVNYSKSLHISQKIKDSIGVFQALNNMGNLYRLKNDNEKALDYYHQALAIESATFNTKNVTAIKNNMAGIYYDIDEFDKAIKLYNESIAISNEINDKTNLATALNGLGFVYYNSKNYNKAIDNFEAARKINFENNFSYDLLDSYEGLAECYLDLKEYDLALVNANELIKRATDFEFLKHKKIAYGLLASIYKNKGNYKKAFENQEKYKVLSDSLLNEENIKKISEIEYEYKYKKELDDAVLRETKLTKTVETTAQDLEKSQRNLLLGIITFLAVAMVLGSIIFYLKLRNSKAKTDNIITEQKLLRTQMTPHFIFNSLSVLQGMILNKEESKSISYLSKFSKLLRITLENSRDKTVLLSHELEAVENYLSLQNIENEKITFQLHVDKAIETNIIKVPPMLIQPFVENAIEHAFKNKKNNCVIEIKLTLDDSKLICVILDNGMGIDSSERNSNQNKKSLATKITKERLDYLSKDFKMDASITIEDRSKYNEQGTKVTIQIPFLKQEA